MFFVFSPFYFQDFGSSFLSLFWILFQVDCLFPLHLLGLVRFCLAPSSAMFFSVFSLCLTYCVWGLLFTGCRFIVPVVFGVCPQWLWLVQWVVSASWWRGLVLVFWWVRLDLVFLVSRCTSGGVFWGVCDLIMILGRLSANGWGCVPVLLGVWHRVSSTIACWSLSGPWSWHWDAGLWEIFSIWYYMELGGLLWSSVLNLALPPQRHSPDAWLENQEPVLHTAQNKREKKKRERKKKRSEERRVGKECRSRWSPYH